MLHAEIRMHRGRPHLVEIAARLGGGALDMVARVTADYCPVRAAMDVACGVRPAVRHYQPTGLHMMGTCLICDAGTLEYVTVPPEVSESEHTLMARITQEPGAVIHRPPDGNNILGFLVVTGNSHARDQAAAGGLRRPDRGQAGRPAGEPEQDPLGAAASGGDRRLNHSLTPPEKRSRGCPTARR